MLKYFSMNSSPSHAYVFAQLTSGERREKTVIFGKMVSCSLFRPQKKVLACRNCYQTCIKVVFVLYSVASFGFFFLVS